MKRRSILFLIACAIASSAAFEIPAIDSYLDHDASLQGSEKCAMINLVIDESGEADEDLQSKQDDQTYLKETALPQISAGLKEAGFDSIFICTHGYGNAQHDSLSEVGHFHGCAEADESGFISTPAGMDTLEFYQEGIEDGWQAIHHSVRDIPSNINGKDIVATCGALAKNMILLTDEWRDDSNFININGDQKFTKGNTMSLLKERGYKLNVISMLQFGYWRYVDPDANVGGDEVSISDWDVSLTRTSIGSTSDSIVFQADGRGDFKTITKYKEQGVPAIDTVVVFHRNGIHRIRDDYAEIAFHTGGAAWSLRTLRRGQAYEEGFTKAFTQYKVQEMVASLEEAPVVTSRQQELFCSKNVELIHSSGETTYQFEPIVIIEQHLTSVKFHVRNPFRNIDSMHVQFDEIKQQKWDFQTGDSECYTEEDVAHSESIEYSAYCMPGNPISIVNVWFSDRTNFNPAFDNAEVPDCCLAADPLDNNPKVQYTFLVHCQDVCAGDNGTTTNVNADRKLSLSSSPLVTPTSTQEEGETDSSTIKRFLRRPSRR